MKRIRRCTVCGAYMLKMVCCGAETAPVSPPKYSPEDKYAGYRRKAKEHIYRQWGVV